MTKTDNHFIEKLELHIEKANSNLKYSIDRFDILIISISSGGLVFSMGFVKDLLSGKCNIDFTLLKISWILFTISITFNLLSQVSGYYASRYDIKVTKNIIRKKKEKSMIGNQCKLELREKIMNNLTMIFNATSLFILISGISIMVVFMSINL